MIDGFKESFQRVPGFRNTKNGIDRSSYSVYISEVNGPFH